ncbi:MAG: bifunctional diaminohydroxyphosphoribosylaminopyrimidine deaminase/5-amino-6-(5-phosphoribosylamino)uracil reductase RibD [Ferruginibacter sp.]
MINNETFMQRCIQLAGLGAGYVAPNPLVGAVLVYKNRIIGEGYHQKFGEPHAEVNCINGVAECDKQFICKSVLYVSLEPCSHTGKTPPCVDFILKSNIPNVVIGCKDPFEKVNGTGIDRLIAAGINVEVNVLKSECIDLNKRFFCFHTKRRPYIILKWAETNDRFIAGKNAAPIKISNLFTDVLVHKYRSHEAAILVGTATALVDNPTLTARHWPGPNPVRVIIDRDLKLNDDKNIFNPDAPTIVINRKKTELNKNIKFYRVEESDSIVTGIMKCLFEQQLNSVIIEGGAKTIQSFIDASLWDEAMIITNSGLMLQDGVQSPRLKNQKEQSFISLFSDGISFLKNISNDSL